MGWPPKVAALLLAHWPLCARSALLYRGAQESDWYAALAGATIESIVFPASDVGGLVTTADQHEDQGFHWSKLGDGTGSWVAGYDHADFPWIFSTTTVGGSWHSVYRFDFVNPSDGSARPVKAVGLTILDFGVSSTAFVQIRDASNSRMTMVTTSAVASTSPHGIGFFGIIAEEGEEIYSVMSGSSASHSSRANNVRFSVLGAETTPTSTITTTTNVVAGGGATTTNAGGGGGTTTTLVSGGGGGTTTTGAGGGATTTVISSGGGGGTTTTVAGGVTTTTVPSGGGGGTTTTAAGGGGATTTTAGGGTTTTTTPGSGGGWGTVTSTGGPSTTATTVGSAGGTTTTLSGGSGGATTTVLPHASGDPHLTNIRGQRFDVVRAGTHTLLHLPRGAAPRKTLLRVDAAVRAIEGERCGPLYIQTLRLTGSWAAAQNVSFFEAEPWLRAHPRGQEHVRVPLGPVRLFVELKQGKAGFRYLNVMMAGLGKVGVPIGGLLGEDDHTWASSDPSCSHRHAGRSARGRAALRGQVALDMPAWELEDVEATASRGSCARAAMADVSVDLWC